MTGIDAPSGGADSAQAGGPAPSTAPRFDQATRVALAVVAVAAAFFVLMIATHAGPMLVGAGCRWAW